MLGAAIDRSVWVGLAPRADARRRFASDAHSGTVELPADAAGRLAGTQSWVNYPLGVLVAMRGSGLKIPAGFDYLAVSNVPSGRGPEQQRGDRAVLLRRVPRGGRRERPARGPGRAGRRAENEFVGVPCGILDQGVSGFGRRGHLVYIDCRGPRFKTVPLPGRSELLGLQHPRQARPGRRPLCREARRVHGGGPGDRGAAPGRRHARRMLAAAETRLSRPAYKRARHVIDEIARVEQAVAALNAGDLAAVGKLLLASHRSSRTWFENSIPELDFLVDCLESEKGVYGARLTGGGLRRGGDGAHLRRVRREGAPGGWPRPTSRNSARGPTSSTRTRRTGPPSSQ